jgi:hypothetical protein
MPIVSKNKKMENNNVFNFDSRPLFVTEFENRYSDKIFDLIINSQDKYDDLREKLSKLLEERRQILEKELKRI